MNTQQLHITHFSEEGWGVAKTSREVIVPYALPQEKVQATVRKTRRWTISHEAVDPEFIELSADRQKPICRHFGTCGGCRWQHVSDALQIAEKEQRVHTLFMPFFTNSEEFHKVYHPLIPSPSWHYRNKMEYTFSSDSKGQKFLGLIMAGSKGKVCTVEECFLGPSWFPQALASIRSWWNTTQLDAYHPRKDQGTLRTVTLRHGFSSGDRMVILTVSGNPQFAITKDETGSLITALNKDLGALSIVLRIQQARKGHPTQFYEMVLQGPDCLRERLEIDIHGIKKEYEFSYSPQAFFQPNPLQASKIYSRAIELARITPSDVVYDLYCGIGIFGMIASSFAKEVVAIELSLESAVDAKTNATQFGLTNFRFFQGDVAEVLRAHTELPSPDVIIVDPPRSGLAPQAIEQILQCQPRTVIYVSCNPKTQARDIMLLLQNGFIIEAIQPIDQFPQTVHIENIVVLHNESRCIR